MSNKKVLIIYTGGTIGMVKNPKTGVLEPMDFSNLISNVPEITQLGVEIESYSFETPIDSTDLNQNNLIEIAKTIESNYNRYDGFIVLHGSDTMSYSASMLSFMLEGLSKAVIFTGSQLPMGHLRTDARENLISSIIFALDERIKEVCLYFEFKLHRGNRSKKISSENFNAFISPNYPFLAETGVNIKVNTEYLLNPKSNKLTVNKIINNNIALLRLYPGISKVYFKSIFNLKDIEAVIIESYGTGNIMSYDWVIEILKDAIQRNVKIVNVSQCFSGEVIQGLYAVSSKLEEIGLIGGKDITCESAIMKTMLLLGKGITTQKEFKKAFLTPIAGELSE